MASAPQPQTLATDGGGTAEPAASATPTKTDTEATDADGRSELAWRLQHARRGVLHEIQDGERHRSAPLDSGAHSAQPFWRDVPCESLFADLGAHPEREPRTGDRSECGQEGRDPPERTEARRENDDGAIDAEGKRDEDRGVESGQDDDAHRRGKERHEPGSKPSHVASRVEARRRPTSARNTSSLKSRVFSLRTIRGR